MSKERAVEMNRMRGVMSDSGISRMFGISKQRIHQILGSRREFDKMRPLRVQSVRIKPSHKKYEMDGEGNTHCLWCSRCRTHNDLVPKSHKFLESNSSERVYYICRTCQRHRGRNYYASAKGKAIVKKCAKNSIRKYPEKQRARRILNKAIEAGKVTRGYCRVCGTEKTEGHHEDYSKPLEMIWLCHSHHMFLHRKVKNRTKALAFLERTC